jgi:hypothetical protein
MRRPSSLDVGYSLAGPQSDLRHAAANISQATPMDRSRPASKSHNERNIDSRPVGVAEVSGIEGVPYVQAVDPNPTLNIRVGTDPRQSLRDSDH